jgi:uncharacterized protein
MRPEVVSALKTLISNRFPDLDVLSIAWFGGEPLLAYDVIVEVMEHCQRFQASKPDAVVTSGMTTNASMLSPDRLERLTALNVRDFQISLDGDRVYHDRVRVRLGGGGSFDAIWHNIIGARRTVLPFTFILRVHVSAENQQHVRRLLELMSRTIQDDDRFQISISPLSRFGGQNDAALPVLAGADRRWQIVPDEVQALREHASSLGLYLLPRGQFVCYASKLNSFVLRSNGRIGKCTVALYDQRNTIGELRPDGSVSIDPEASRWWSRGLFSGDRDELACPIGAARLKNKLASSGDGLPLSYAAF